MNITTPLFSMVVLVFINLLFSYKGKKLYWLYELSHFIGGFILASLFLNFLDAGWVLLAVLTSGVLWEIYEVVIVKNKKIKKYLENNFKYYTILPTFSDTMIDLLLDVSGAAFYLYLF